MPGLLRLIGKMYLGNNGRTHVGRGLSNGSPVEVPGVGEAPIAKYRSHLDGERRRIRPYYFISVSTHQAKKIRQIKVLYSTTKIIRKDTRQHSPSQWYGNLNCIYQPIMCEIHLVELSNGGTTARKLHSRADHPGYAIIHWFRHDKCQSGALLDSGLINIRE